MIIGGYALPFYGRIRTTIDIDLAVVIKTEEEFKRLLELLRSENYEMSSTSSTLILVLDCIEKMEIELWLKPDGITFDEETLKRRQKVKLDAKLWAWIISAEDFIVNKLARPDRGAIDEQDVKSVLIRQKDHLDYVYLEKRAKEAGVFTVLQTIQRLP